MSFTSDRHIGCKMFSTSDRRIQSLELLRNSEQKLEIFRDCLRDKFARDDLQPDSSANLDVLEKRSDLSDLNLGPIPNFSTISSQDINLKDCNGMFQLLNVAQFRPDEIETKVIGDLIVVHCKHDEQFDEHCWISREFTRRFKVPEGIDLFTVRSVLKNGVLVIAASKNIAKLASSEGIQIQIEIESY